MCSKLYSCIYGKQYTRLYSQRLNSRESREQGIELEISGFEQISFEQIRSEDSSESDLSHQDHNYQDAVTKNSESIETIESVDETESLLKNSYNET